MAAVEDSKSNPFPGMNPFLELQWSDVHTVLISYIRDALSDELPEDLRSLVEEHLRSRARPTDYRRTWRSSSDGRKACRRSGSPMPRRDGGRSSRRNRK